MYCDQIYMIRHKITGRMYIGRSQEVPKRIYSHMSRLRAGKHPVEDMQSDFDKYGDTYEITILGERDNHNLDLEFEMMKKFNSTTRGIGYNYKDPHVTNKIRSEQKERTPRSKLNYLIKTLSESEVEFSYDVLSKVFNNTKTKPQFDSQKAEYISKIIEVLSKSNDIELFDFILQLINKSK